MLKGKFIGPLKVLHNKTAHIREIKGDQNYVLAQFDDLKLATKFTHNWIKVAKRYFKFLKD